VEERKNISGRHERLNRWEVRKHQGVLKKDSSAWEGNRRRKGKQGTFQGKWFKVMTLTTKKPDDRKVKGKRLKKGKKCFEGGGGGRTKALSLP